MFSANSLTAVNAITHIQGFLQGVFPGISEQVTVYLAKLVCAIPICVVIFGNEWVGAKLLPRLSAPAAKFVAPLWDRVKLFANIGLGAILGGLAGDSTLGPFAAIVWKIAQEGGKGMFRADLAQVVKNKAIVGLVALGSLWAGVSYAQEAQPVLPVKPTVSLFSQSTFGVGAGFERAFKDGEDSKAFLDGQLGFSWNHLAPRVRVIRYFGTNEPWKGEVALRLIVW